MGFRRARGYGGLENGRSRLALSVQSTDAKGIHAAGLQLFDRAAEMVPGSLNAKSMMAVPVHGQLMVLNLEFAAFGDELRCRAPVGVPLKRATGRAHRYGANDVHRIDRCGGICFVRRPLVGTLGAF